jgi:hypothetical protein
MDLVIVNLRKNSSSADNSDICDEEFSESDLAHSDGETKYYKNFYLLILLCATIHICS